VYYGTTAFTSPSTNFPASANPNLQILGVSITNAGSYYVIVTNGSGGATSSPASLSVPPYIVTQPTNREVGAGQNASFSVLAAADQPLGYSWLLNQTIPIAGATGPSYTTNADIGSDGSTYRVVVSNSLGVVTSAVATLTVDAVPSVTLQPTNQAVVVGNDFAFHAQALGTQP